MHNINFTLKARNEAKMSIFRADELVSLNKHKELCVGMTANEVDNYIAELGNKKMQQFNVEHGDGSEPILRRFLNGVDLESDIEIRKLISSRQNCLNEFISQGLVAPIQLSVDKDDIPLRNILLSLILSKGVIYKAKESELQEFIDLHLSKRDFVHYESTFYPVSYTHLTLPTTERV